MIPLQSQPIPKQLKRMIEWVGNSSRPLDGVSTSGAGGARVWTTALYLLVRTGHFPTTLLGVQAVTITSLPNIFLSHSLQTVLGVCCPVFRLQLSAMGWLPKYLMFGHELGETWGDFTSFKWQVCANEDSLRVLGKADASYICRVPAFNKDFTLGTRAFSSKGGDRDVKSICQMLVSQLVLRFLSLCTLGLAACNVHFPAGRTSHTSNTGKKKIAQRENA